MCGLDNVMGLLFSYVDFEECILVWYLLCKIRVVVNDVLCFLDVEFDWFYVGEGWFFVVFEWLIWVSLL